MIADYPRDPESIDGGVQAVTVYLIRELTKSREINLRLVTFDETISKMKMVRRNGFVQYLLPRQRLGLPVQWKCDFMRLQACLRAIRPAVVHAQGAGIDGYLAVKSGYPSVVTFHGIMREDAKYKSDVRARLRMLIQGWATERYCARNAQRTILISDYVRRYYGNALRSVSCFIPNPVDSSFFDVQRGEEPGRILFAGRLIPRKGVNDLIEAFAATRRHGDARLILAGSVADRRYVERLKRKTSDLGISPYVEFLGLLKETELLDEFARAALLVLPSYQETAPMVIQQAMAAAIPIVATGICGVPGQVDDGGTGLLFRPGDVHKLAEHLTKLITNRNVRLDMGRAGRTRALAEYRAEEIAKRTLNIYRVLGGW